MRTVSQLKTETLIVKIKAKVETKRKNKEATNKETKAKVFKNMYLLVISILQSLHRQSCFPLFIFHQILFTDVHSFSSLSIQFYILDTRVVFSSPYLTVQMFWDVNLNLFSKGYEYSTLLGISSCFQNTHSF